MTHDESHYLIEPALGCAFALIPRCGTTSLIAALRPEYLSSRDPALLNTPGHLVVGKLDHYSEVVASGLPVVVFTRDWRDRAMSAATKLERTNGFDPATVMARHVEGKSVDEMDIHFKPQASYLEGLNVAFVGSLANMATDWVRLGEQLGVTLPPLPARQSSNPPDWRETSYDFTQVSTTYAADEPLHDSAFGLPGVSAEHTFQRKREQPWRIDSGDFEIVRAGHGRTHYPVGFPSGSGPVNLWALVSGQRVVLEYDIALSDPFVGNVSGVNKVGFGWMHNNPVLYGCLRGISGSLSFAPDVAMQNTGEASEGARDLTQNINRVTVAPGQRFAFRIEAVGNTPGQADGICRWWIDDLLVGEHTDCHWAQSGQSNIWHEASWFPIWGGGTALPAVPTAQHMDIYGLRVRSA